MNPLPEEIRAYAREKWGNQRPELVQIAERDGWHLVQVIPPLGDTRHDTLLELHYVIIPEHNYEANARICAPDILDGTGAPGIPRDTLKLFRDLLSLL